MVNNELWECYRHGAQTRAYNGGPGEEPLAGSRGRAPDQVRGRYLLKRKGFWLLDIRWKPQICLIL